MTDDSWAYPVRVEASLDAPISRWLWLVKWFLLIPHLVVLAFLWIAFTVLTVIAWFAILITGQYPRVLFDFNLGVLRWSWRVHYYGYGALGTDRYPPFTLADVPDYPARLDVPYPQRLSRGLVLVKSWLLALPHLLVVAVFAGGGLWISTTAGRDDGASNSGWGAGGLIGLLVLIAAIVLLFSGRYPRPLYDFVLGMDRWVLRVVAYVALMTDRYPPFRLDMGGHEPDARPVGPSGPGPSPIVAGTAPPRPAGGWRTGRVVAVVVGSVLLFGSTGLLLGGATLAWADTTQREDGYVWSWQDRIGTDTYALVTGDVVLEGAGLDWGVGNILGDAGLQVTSADPGAELFLGVARSSDVTTYLRDTGYFRVDRLSSGWGWNWGPRGQEYAGGSPSTPPGDGDFWVEHVQGAGTQTLTWTPEEGDWTVVVMNADASPGLDVQVRLGATAPGLPWLWGILLVLGAVALVLGALLITLAVHRARSGPGGAVLSRQDPPPGPFVDPGGDVHEHPHRR